MTGFRTSKGVNSTEFFNRFGIKLEDVLQGKFTKYVEQNNALISNENDLEKFLYIHQYSLN